MSLFRWFGKKSGGVADPGPETVGLGADEHTLPMGGKAASSATRAATDGTGARKQERLERREALYRVVRDCMTQVGVLSSTYKFKVLSLDSHGKQYLIMVDMPASAHAGAQQWSQIEGLIARSAKAQHEILVTAVYWRTTDLVSSANVGAGVGAPAVAALAASTLASQATSQPAQASVASTVPDNTAQDKTAALNALFADAAPVTKTATPDFQDTEISEPAAELGRTQYGDLN